jgi:metal-responsive CopG/Arc/MetJ family transcriptional regulator
VKDEVRFTLRLPKRMSEQFEKICEALGQTRAEVIRSLIFVFIQENKDLLQSGETIRAQEQVLPNDVEKLWEMFKSESDPKLKVAILRKIKELQSRQ